MKWVSKRTKVPPVNSAVCTISKPAQQSAMESSVSFSCCLGNVFSSTQKDLETQGARSTTQKPKTRSHVSRLPNLPSPLSWGWEGEALRCGVISKERAGQQSNLGRSGKLSNSCTAMALRKHLACAFQPITQACLQAKQLFWQCALLQSSRENRSHVRWRARTGRQPVTSAICLVVLVCD